MVGFNPSRPGGDAERAETGRGTEPKPDLSTENKTQEVVASVTAVVVPALIPGEEEVGVLESANYAQRDFAEAFSAKGAFAGETVSSVAESLKSGELSAADVPVQYIVRDGNTLMLNTRSAQALEQAGVPRSEWNAVNMTGDAAAEARLTNQLKRSNLTSEGTPTVTPRKNLEGQ